MYQAPVSEIAFTLRHIAGASAQIEQGLLGDLSDDLLDAILTEAGRFASEEVAPLGPEGDNNPASLVDGKVNTPTGWPDLYKRWAEGGWNAVCGSGAYGGQGLPTMIGAATHEMWNSGSMAFGVGPILTMGAIEALDHHGSEQLKTAYLEKLISGQWMGTMNLTEPHAGSDLATLKTRAEPVGDGTYRVYGQKIFITYGEHDWTENIIHLVLARLPDAPPGTRGISLFLVPKFLLNEDGTPGARNDVYCHSLEHKLGIHGSPTCTMIYGDGKFGDEPGAIGYLIGEENRGLNCMFTMMNNARLLVGIQGVAVAEAAYQKARTFADERRQGKAQTWTGTGMAPIVEHPDVQRTLLTMKALASAARSICYACAHAIDLARIAPENEKDYWQHRANLLTPIAKAFATDVGVDAASMGVQIHGGMGFVEETGAARFLRDARIAPIYEGTNGIQAIDLVTRKLPLANGQATVQYLDELTQIADQASRQTETRKAAEKLQNALTKLRDATAYLHNQLETQNLQDALAGATPYLRLFALVAGAAYHLKGAMADRENQDRAALANFYCDNLLVEATGLAEIVLTGAESLHKARQALQ